MNKIKVVSFDAEGTLVTPQFSQAVWNEGIPALYAVDRGIGLEQAKALVEQEYQRVGEQRMEWYDIKYWFRYFGLGDYQELLYSYKCQASLYPEVEEVLFSLSRSYRLIIVSNSAREFLDILLEGVREHFIGIFSSISDFGGLKTANFYLKVCQAMQVKPEEMVHIGDNREFDFLVPQRAGIRAFYLDRNGESRGWEVVKDLKDFQKKLLENSPDIFKEG